MDRHTDFEVLQTAVEWLEDDTTVVLATVARTWGSAPRRPGAMMAINHEGAFVGSVSGGCIEDDLVQRSLRGEFEHQPACLVEYGIDSASTGRLGLPCGGRLQILVESIESPAPLGQILNSVNQGQCITRSVCLNTGEASLHRDKQQINFSFDDDYLVKKFGPEWRLLLIGAGELSRRVAQLAMTLDYRVTICDPRPEYAANWSVDGVTMTTENPAIYMQAYNPDKHTVILALAHAPALEDEAIATALRTDAFYVGALGSRKHQQARRKRLPRYGVTPQQLELLHGPVGLALGSHTPAEIAIAICADLVQQRNQTATQKKTVNYRNG